MSLYAPRPHRCPGCGFPHEHCGCHLIQPVPCTTNILIVRHRAERNKASNTGGLTSVMLGCKMITHGQAGPPTTLPDLGDAPRVLAPFGKAAWDPPPSTLVILDATWAQVRKMRSRIAPLPHVPALGLPAAPAIARIRRPHLAEGMSTMEAVAGALELLGEPEPAAALRELYAKLTERWLMIRRGT